MTRTHKIALVIAATLTLLVGLALFQAARQAASHPDKGTERGIILLKSRLAESAAARPARRSAAGQPPAGQMDPGVLWLHLLPGYLPDHLGRVAPAARQPARRAAPAGSGADGQRRSAA